MKVNFANNTFIEFQKEKDYKYKFYDKTNLLEQINYHINNQDTVVLTGDGGFGKTRFVIEYAKRYYLEKTIVIDFIKLNSFFKIDNFMISCLINRESTNYNRYSDTLTNDHNIKDWDFVLSYINKQIYEVQNFNVSNYISQIFGNFIKENNYLLILENAHEIDLTHLREYFINLNCKKLISINKNKITNEQLNSIKAFLPCVHIEQEDVTQNIKNIIKDISYNDETIDFLKKYSNNSFYKFNKYIDALIEDEILEKINNKYLFEYQKNKNIPTTFYQCLNTLFSQIRNDTDIVYFLHIIASYNEQYFPESIATNKDILNRLCELTIIKPSNKNLYVFDHEMIKDYVFSEFKPIDSKRYNETILNLLTKNDNVNFYDKIANIFATIEEWEYAIAFLYEYSKALQNNIEKIKILEQIIEWINEWQTHNENNGKIKELEVLEELIRLKQVVYGKDSCSKDINTLFLVAKSENNQEYMVIARCLGAWSNDLEGKSNIEEAYNYLRKHRLSNKLKYYRNQNLFDLCTKEKAFNSNFNKALFYIKKAKKRISKQDKELLFYYWQGIGSVYLEQMNFQKAYKSWEQAYLQVKDNKNYYQEKYCDILCDYAYIKAMFNTKDAYDYLNQAIRVSVNYNFSRNICRAYINKANHLFYNLNNNEEALRNIEKAISYAQMNKDNYMLMISLFSKQMFDHNSYSKYTKDSICVWAFDYLKTKSGDNRIKNIVIFYFSVNVLMEIELKTLNNQYIDNKLEKRRNNIDFEDIEKNNLYYKNGKYAIYY